MLSTQIEIKYAVVVVLYYLYRCFSTFLVKLNPLQQFAADCSLNPCLFWVGGLLRPEGPKFEAEGREWGGVLGEGQRAPSSPARECQPGGAL